MHLIGLDLNSTRARAVHGPHHLPCAPLALEGDRLELPLAISLGERHPVLGQPGAARCRSTPHLVCQEYLPHLGEDRSWSGGRHRLDPTGAFKLLLQALSGSLGRADAVVSVVPDYLTDGQVNLLTQLAHKARWQLMGTIPVSVAAGLAVQPQLPWPGVVLVVDLDGHALTVSGVSVNPTDAYILVSRSNQRLARGIWLNKLLDGVANRCVRISRRDPRQSAEADQSLHDQLVQMLYSPEEHNLVEFALRTSQWSQHLMLRSEELASFCGPLLQQAVGLVHSVMSEVTHEGSLAGIVVTASARGLPGLVTALDRNLAQMLKPVKEDEVDFGESLMYSEAMTPYVHPLEADALGQVAHQIGVAMLHGQCPQGHLVAAPVVAGSFIDPGPARLHFRGRDHFLSSSVFTLGRAPDCSLIFESDLYPTVSARHCDIFLDRRTYMLRDRSRYGTLVNERPVRQQSTLRSGDRIRLGPMGPIVQFLGR